MSGITTAQMRKIHALARERGLDSDMLHAYIFKIAGKDSMKFLTIAEAIKVIDGLQDGEKTAGNMATYAQRKYITGLLIEIGWVDEAGKPDMERFRKFIKNKFGVEHENWLTVKAASNIIEAFKEIRKRESRRAQC